MGNEKVECDHRCRNTCAMLAEGLHEELSQVVYYERLVKNCDDPETKKFAEEILGSHRELARRITEQLSTIKTKAQMLDAIIASYES